MAHLEASRRGGHLWIFFTQPLPAAQARTWLLPWCPVGIEFYPKQDQSTGYGSLIRLPLGVHRLTGKRYPWIGAFSRDGKPVKAATTVKETLTWLEQQEKVDPSHFVSRHRHFVSHLGRAYETSHTREVSQSPRNNIDNPSSPTTAHTLHEWCCQQDPFDLIGRYVELDARGVGLCPFGEHHRRGKDCHPSFKVYRPRSPGRACWHCYTWGKGGNVFNFLCYYYGLDAAMMWQRIQAGGVV
ncbi:hypothetical protein EPA93_33030 [Ktedonosporobacter rubrisoli]|uniref:Uncharacterized protein n=2 Tax=Ktedonosporobacter rubrisoli TaxID=2509675 RepID=A0A4P6K5T6_KTERU|nr:hypothetical protein EPA93_33030 [Ktedonosporobacter rubrisoli]